MSFSALVLTVLVASPGDTRDARDAVERTVRSWNADRARTSGVVLLPLRWEKDAVSDLAHDAQSAINEQLVDHADIVIGLFDGRLGTPTARALSGTVEEIERSLKRGSRVHVYFAGSDLPRDVDVEQLVAIRSFKAELESRGLVGGFLTLAELVEQVRRALENDVHRLTGKGGVSPGSGLPAAKLVPSFTYDEDAGGGPGAPVRRLRPRIEVRNVGDVTADDVRLHLVPLDGGETPINRFDESAGWRVPAGSSRSYPIYPTAGSARLLRVHLAWREDGEEFTEAVVVEAE